MDLESRKRWIEYSKAKEVMFEHTDIKESPWYVVDADIKKHARINCISHLLNQFEYKDLTHKDIELPERQSNDSYVRPPIDDQNFVPNVVEKYID